MRILWIGKSPTDGAGGDEVFDRKTIAACRAQRLTVDTYHPKSVGRVREVIGLVRGYPAYRARFSDPADVTTIAGLASAYDAVVCSWEPLDHLVRDLRPRAILILHNVTSRALPSIYPNNQFAKLAARQLQRWEKRTYHASNVAAVGALSRNDYRYLLDLHPNAFLMPPGMPPVTPLHPDAVCKRELVISGTYEWGPKRRDIEKFAHDYDMDLPIYADALPSDVAKALRARSSLPDANATIRFGLIADRFEAGHKLKTLAYIANNQIVVSFAEVGFDFMHIPDCDLFIRRVHQTRDIAQHMSVVMAMAPDELRQRFVRFRSACFAEFSWDAAATRLIFMIKSSLTAVAYHEYCPGDGKVA